MQICSDAAARARRHAEFGGISDHVRHRLVRRPDQRVLPRIAGDQLEVRRLSPVPTDLAAAFASFRAGGAEAINVLSSSMLFGAREELGRLSLTHKLPAICEWREMAEAGCVASYATRLLEGWAMLAALTDKMLKGAQPGETPAQQPTRFELVINLKTAKALGLTVPQSILARADEVIE